MEFEEKGDGQHGAAAAPKRAEDIARQILQGVSELGKTNMAKAQNVAATPTRPDEVEAAIQRGSLCYTKEEVAWRDKMSRLDELMGKAPCITVDVFVASVRAVFGTGEG